MKRSEKAGTLLVAHYPQMPPSEKNGDNGGRTLSANAAVGENGDITGSTLSANAAVGENRDITGSTLSANAAVREKRGHYW